MTEEPIVGSQRFRYGERVTATNGNRRIKEGRVKQNHPKVSTSSILELSLLSCEFSGHLSCSGWADTDSNIVHFLNHHNYCNHFPKKNGATNHLLLWTFCTLIMFFFLFLSTSRFFCPMEPNPN